LYLTVGKFIDDNNLKKFYDLSQEDKIKYLVKISDIIKDYINEQSRERTQKQDYNSPVTDFDIVFEIEKIALSGLFTTKKKYATWTLLEDGKAKDAMSITGLEVKRSDSPEVVKPMIIHVLEMILKQEPDNKLRYVINSYKHDLLSVSPDEIAENKGVNKLDKYLVNEIEWKKGTPHQLKGVANLRFFLKEFKLENKYDLPQEGVKAKVVYLKKNRYNRESLTFYKWPKELQKYGVEVDYTKMIENNFFKKIKNYLKYIEKLNLLNPPSLF
jgi:DNA polymerase elongation subunit (family B)